MDKQEEAIFNKLLERLEKEEKGDLSSSQKIREGFAEKRETEAKEKEEAFKKYAEKGKDIEQLTPLEKWAILEHDRQLKMDQEREKLGKAMAELKKSQEQKKNWINRPTIDPKDIKH